MQATRRRNDHLTAVISTLLLLITLSLHTLVNADPPPKRIALTEIVAHPSLEEAKRGILDELKANGYEVGKNLEIIEDNANGNIATAAMIAKKMVSLKPDAIVAISTPSAQTVYKAAQHSQIPIVFSSVTDPVAANLTQNISGATDAPPLAELIVLIKTLQPTLKTLGVLYNPAEANSVKTLKDLQVAVQDEFVVIPIPLNNSNELKPTLSSVIGKVDAIYLPSDNTVFSAMPLLVKLAKQHKLPLFSSDPDSVKQGVLACVGVTQYEVGRAAGKCLVRLLNGDKQHQIVQADALQLVINKDTAQVLGIDIPTGIADLPATVVGGVKP